MEIVLNKMQNPLRKLRKSLKRLPDDPSVEGVHSLRTRARKVEAVSSALMKDHKKKTREMLKSVKPVRKAAGEVRDMDVLIANVLSLPQEQENDSRLRLVEHLGQMRTESARKLLDMVDANWKSASRNLKSYSKSAGKWLQKQNGTDLGIGPVAITLAIELSRWPKFNRNNIHPFRIKVKELQYMLQLSANPNPKLLDTMDKVKNRIGEWHDWYELEAIAAKVLDRRTDRGLMAQIKETGNRKLGLALDAANTMRKRYLHHSKAGGGRSAAHLFFPLFELNGTPASTHVSA